MDFQALYAKFGTLFSSPAFEENTRQLYELEKRVCHDDFERSTAWVAETMRNAGFEQVERIAHSADGETSACDATMPEAWNLDGRAFLKVVSPWLEAERIIADSNEIAYAAATWCGATPDEGSTGELVLFDPVHPEKARGKWVLCETLPSGVINQPLAHAGALGIVATDFEQGWRDPDSTRWMNGQGQWGWYYVKGDLRLPIFAITARRAMMLKNELLNGRKVVLHGVLKARIGRGKIYTVTGVIPGENEEEYAIFAHLYEPFLSDDASGVAAGIEIGRMLKNSGLKLKKSLRVVFSMEHYGFLAYLTMKTHHIKAAMNMDMLATTMYRDLGFPLHWRMSAACLPFFGDLLMLKILEECEPGLRIDCRPGNLSDDTMAGEPLLGIPTNWLYVENGPSPFHHSSNAVFADVDWILAEKVSCLVSVFAAFLLTADRSDYESLLGDFERLAREQVIRHADDIPYQRKVHCDFAEGELLSVNGWMPGLVSPEKAAGAVAGLRLPDAELTAETPNEKNAAQMVIKRLQPGTPWSLARIPYEKRNYFGGRRKPLYFTLLDGKRTLLESVRIADAMLGKNTSDEDIGKLIKFLRYLADYGYVKILRDEELIKC